MTHSGRFSNNAMQVSELSRAIRAQCHEFSIHTPVILTRASSSCDVLSHGVGLDAQYLFTLGKSRLGKRRRAGFEEKLEKRVREFTRDNCTYCNDHYNLASTSL